MMKRRLVLLASVAAFVPSLVMADESIAGQWEANLGHNVLIAMDIIADGHWNSQTVENNNVVAEMAGTYKQTKKNATSGKLVFTPVTSKTNESRGAAVVEEDEYTLEKGGDVLRLVSGKDVMVFEKQPLAK